MLRCTWRDREQKRRIEEMKTEVDVYSILVYSKSIINHNPVHPYIPNHPRRINQPNPQSHAQVPD